MSCTELSRFNKHILYRNTIDLIKVLCTEIRSILISISCTQIGRFNKESLCRNTVGLWHISCRDIYFEHGAFSELRIFKIKSYLYLVSNTKIYLIFAFPYFNGEMFRYFRPSSGYSTETELMVHAVQVCSLGIPWYINIFTAFLQFLYWLMELAWLAWDPLLRNFTVCNLSSVSVRWPDGQKEQNMSPLK